MVGFIFYIDKKIFLKLKKKKIIINNKNFSIKSIFLKL